MDLLLVRRLRPYHTNTKKRLVKSLKGYVRDSGVTHALLGITGSDRCASPTGMVTPGFLPFGDTCTSLYIVAARTPLLQVVLEYGGIADEIRSYRLF